MTQEHKELIVKDLCARLPYGVKVDIPDLFISTKTNVEVLNEIFCGDDGEFRCNGSGMLIKHVRPYLFPMSSMTEEQKKEFELSFDLNYASAYSQELQMAVNMIKWLNKNHFDYNGLIDKGLAIDATGKNIY